MRPTSHLILEMQSGDWDGRTTLRRSENDPRVWDQAASLAPSNCSAVMHRAMACRTKRDQILFRIVAGLAAEFFVMDFEVGHGAARLASPAIAT